MSQEILAPSIGIDHPTVKGVIRIQIRLISNRFFFVKIPTILYYKSW